MRSRGMRLFHHSNRTRNAETRRVYALFELVYTVVDFAAAVCFLSGALLMFVDDARTGSTWLFVIGSVLFLSKPALRLARELQLLRMDRVGQLARRAGDDEEDG